MGLPTKSAGRLGRRLTVIAISPGAHHGLLSSPDMERDGSGLVSPYPNVAVPGSLKVLHIHEHVHRRPLCNGGWANRAIGEDDHSNPSCFPLYRSGGRRATVNPAGFRTEAEALMARTKLTLLGCTVLTAWPALAQTAPSSPTPPAAPSGAAAPATGIGEYWLVILLALMLAAVIGWYIRRRRSGR